MKLDATYENGKGICKYILDKEEAYLLLTNGIVSAHAWLDNIDCGLVCIVRDGNGIKVCTESNLPHVVDMADVSAPVYVLDGLETQELESTGYVEREDMCFTMMDSDIRVYKLTENYDGVKLTGGIKNA